MWSWPLINSSIIPFSRYEIRPAGPVLLYIIMRATLHRLCRALHNQCAFESKDKRRCPERRRLEFHHEAYGLGGDRSARNIKLMCREHNLYMAELDYGKETMDLYRSSTDRVREPAPSFELRPDGALRTLPHRAAM